MGWKSLHHPNVLPLLGVTMTTNQFVMVSEWMVRGSINEFVKADLSADHLELVCLWFWFLISAYHQYSYDGCSSEKPQGG